MVMEWCIHFYTSNGASHAVYHCLSVSLSLLYINRIKVNTENHFIFNLKNPLNNIIQNKDTENTQQIAYWPNRNDGVGWRLPTERLIQ